LLNIKLFFCKYPQIFVDIKNICENLYNGYAHEYRYGYETDIYLAGMVP